MQKVKFRDLGLIDYKEAWGFQEEIFNNIISVKSNNRKQKTEIQTENFLIFCEHPHVYTLGKSGNSKNLLVDTMVLDKLLDTLFLT